MFRKNLIRNLVISVVAVVVVVIIVILGGQSNTESKETTLVDPTIPRGIAPDGTPFLGNSEAPVTIVLYEDMGCPNCRAFEQTVEPAIIKDFILNGEVKLQVITLAFVNRESLPGAEALACAADQSKFWDFRALLFSNQGKKSFTRQNLVEMANEINLDQKLFTNCYDLQKHSKAITDQTQQAFEFGIEATPTFEINGERYVGVYPYEVIGTSQEGVKAFIQQALSEVKQ